LKHDKIQNEAAEPDPQAPPVDLLDAYDCGDHTTIAYDIMNIMEQGILVWSGDGICELHNTGV